LINQYLIKLGNGELVSLLLDKNCQDAKMDGLLLEAIELNKMEVITALLEHNVDLNKHHESSHGYKEWYPLITAASKGNHKLIKLFLDLGADPNVASKVYLQCEGSQELMSPLMVVTFMRCLVEPASNSYNINSYCKCAELLIKAGADVNYQSEFGMTPLKYAIGNCIPKMIQLLLKNGAKICSHDGWDIFLKQKYSFSPKNKKLEKDVSETWQILVKHGINIYLYNEAGTMVEVAMNRCHYSKYNYEYLPVIKYIFNDLKTNETSAFRKQYLKGLMEKAVKNGDWEVYKLLIDSFTSDIDYNPKKLLEMMRPIFIENQEKNKWKCIYDFFGNWNGIRIWDHLLSNGLEFDDKLKEYAIKNLDTILAITSLGDHDGNLEYYQKVRNILSK